MKIYEIIDTADPCEPTYMPTRKKAEQEALSLGFNKNEFDEVIREMEFEYNLDSICQLCQCCWR